jgi:putative endonuclease
VEAGLIGQNEAEKFLTGKGYRILERNYRVKSGEIDLIARDGEYIVFIEVKTRTNLLYGYPCEAVGGVKQRRIRQTALHYITRHRLSGDFRFDVVEVLKQKDGAPEITHLENAF